MINLLVLLWVVVAFMYFLGAKFRKDKKMGRAFWDFGDFRWLVLSVTALLLVLVVVHVFRAGPRFASAGEMAAYGERTRQPWLVAEAMHLELKDDSLDLDRNFRLVLAHVDRLEAECPDTAALRRERQWMILHFASLAQSSDERASNTGHLCLAAFCYYTSDELQAKQVLELITTPGMKYYNFLAGSLSYYYSDPEGAIDDYRHEIMLGGYKEGAYEKLAFAYALLGKQDELKALVYSDEGQRYVPYEFRQEVYYASHDWHNYFTTQFLYIFSGLTPIALAGALLVMLTWIFYLRNINRNNALTWKRALLTLLLAAVFVLPVWFVYDTYRYVLHFRQTGSTWNDLLYCVLGIGALEELIKILPFLLLLRFTAWIREPIDYLVYASLTAIGFAFVENLRYFALEQHGIDAIHSRAFSAVISHMIDSSIIAYGLILARFRYHRNPVLFFLPFFLIAAVSHGFYDFWIINDQAREFSIITLVYLFTSVLFYSSFINNALNHSAGVQDDIRFNTRLLSSNLAASLVAVLLFELAALSFVYGHVIAEREFFSSIVTGGYMILFLSVRLSNIDIVPGEWAPIQFFTSLNPLNIIYTTKLNQNSVVGLTLRLTPLNEQSILFGQLPLDAQVTRRERVSGFHGWFRIRLERPVMVQGRAYAEAFIRSRDRNELIENDSEVVVMFSVLANEDALDRPEKKKGDLLFVDWVEVN
jgi:RsiW-degrading membrane proteinase PrsW (M82 family)